MNGESFGGIRNSAVLRTLLLSGSFNTVYTAHFVCPNSPAGKFVYAGTVR